MQLHEFGNTLYRDHNAMLEGIAFEFWTAGGLNSPEQIDDLGCSDDGMDEAHECIDGWGLDLQPDGDSQSHMEFNGYTAEDLAKAMREFWDTRPDKGVE